MARTPIDRAAQLRRYADIIGKTVTPMGAPVTPYSNPNWARLAQGLVGAGFQGAAERAASREDVLKRGRSLALANALIGRPSVAPKLPAATGPMAGFDEWMFPSQAAARSPSLPVRNPDGSINLENVAQQAVYAGESPVGAIGSAVTFGTAQEELKEKTRIRELRESFMKPPQIITSQVEIAGDFPGETVIQEKQININDPYQWTERERMIIGTATDPGKAMLEVLKYRATVAKNEDAGLKGKAGRGNQLRDDFIRDTKDWFTVMHYAQNGLNASNNHIGDVTVLFAYLKAIDPNSVVRPGEVTLTNPALISPEIAAIWNSLTDPSGGFGRRLLKEKRKEIEGELKQLARKAQKGFKYQKDLYTDRAINLKVSPDQVVYDPFGSGMIQKLPEGYGKAEAKIPEGFTIATGEFEKDTGKQIYRDKDGNAITLD